MILVMYIVQLCHIVRQSGELSLFFSGFHVIGIDSRHNGVKLQVRVDRRDTLSLVCRSETDRGV